MNQIKHKLAELGGLHPCIGPGSSGKMLPFTEQEIVDLEHELCARLPSGYRQFLAEYGACSFDAIVSSHPDLYFRVAHFYGGGPDMHHISHLLGARSTVEGRMPESLLPIAAGDDGEICIGIRGATYGKIYYWDRWEEWDWQQQDRLAAGESLSSEEEFQNVTELAESFEAFLLALVNVHPDD